MNVGRLGLFLSNWGCFCPSSILEPRGKRRIVRLGGIGRMGEKECLEKSSLRNRSSPMAIFKVTSTLFLLLPMFAHSSFGTEPRRPSACICSDKPVISQGESAVISWNSACATAVSITPDKRFYTHRNWFAIRYPNWRELNLKYPKNGSMVVAPQQTTTYYIIARRRTRDINRNGKADGIRRATRRCVTVQVND